MFVTLFIILITVFIYYKLIKPASYWKDRDVTHIKSWPLIGSMKDFILKKKHLTDVIRDMYNEYPDKRYVGFTQFIKPALMIRDLELIKTITVKEFDHFPDRLAFQKIKTDPIFSKSLPNLSGEKWKRMRTTLSPVFTSSKMRIMYNLMTECAENFTKYFEGKETVKIEMKDISSRFTTDVIATTAFGITVNSLSDRNNEFFTAGTFFNNFGFLTGLKMFFIQLAPAIANFLNMRMFPESLTSFFNTLIKDNIKKREKGGIIRPDLIHLLMQARKGQLKTDEKEEKEDANFASVDEVSVGEKSGKIELTDESIAAQAMVFFLAGFDTVSTASSFMAHELALQPEIQEKLQKEIEDVARKHDGKVPYETLLSMKYLDQVVCETLRLWPPGFQIDRVCDKDYVIEPKMPGERKVVIPQDFRVMIPIIGIHRDAKYFPNPDKFDPERFSDENKSKIVQGSYLPFGSGPRNCIASRFALLETKILFFHLLSKFNIVPVAETEIPMKMSPKKFRLVPDNGFNLGLKPRVK